MSFPPSFVLLRTSKKNPVYCIVDFFLFPLLFRSFSAVALFFISAFPVLAMRSSRVGISSFCWVADHLAGELLHAVH